MTFEELTETEQQAITTTLRAIADQLAKAAQLAGQVKASTKGRAWEYIAAAIAKLDADALVPNENRLQQASTIVLGGELQSIVALQEAFKALFPDEVETLCVNVCGAPACLPGSR